MGVDHQKNVIYKQKFMITCIKSSLNKSGELCSIYKIEPLEIGHGITIGNALRRTLLSQIPGLGINLVKIYGVTNEYINLSFLREDTLEIISNLKKVVLKKTKDFNYSHTKGFICVKGPKSVAASSINFYNNNLSIVNPSQYICTLNQNFTLYIELYINESYGYKNIKSHRSISYNEKLHSFIQLDTLYNPIKRVNYKIALLNDNKGFLKESIIFEILTNGSISPRESLAKTVNILLDTFYPLLYNY
jgi:DNA-directed RNA polymerase subunit alpha